MSINCYLVATKNFSVTARILLLSLFLTSFGVFGQDLHKIDLLTYGGLPADSAHRNIQVLYNTAFITGYSNELKNPLWTAYRFGNQKGIDKSPNWERPFDFKIDRRTTALVKHDDYNGTMYDRGHMAPNSGILGQYGQMAQLETFLMSNISPQKPDLNRKIWARLETVIRETISQDDTKNKEVHDAYVICGPIFEKHPIDTMSIGIAIPTSFFCIISYQRGYSGTVKSVALKIPQDPQSEIISSYFTTIDEIERVTNFNFFPELTIRQQENLESKKRDFLFNELR